MNMDTVSTVPISLRARQIKVAGRGSQFAGTVHPHSLANTIRQCPVHRHVSARQRSVIYGDAQPGLSLSGYSQETRAIRFY
ncbi:hypothetical protein [Salmonella sp. SG203]|uniref:hypothetical protein n=1 Tax=Salmonella sp. SG203 TaxID=2555397 RepID=UPI0015839E5A|nr:hypothetical protein [Salmonella sp. SG203]